MKLKIAKTRLEKIVENWLNSYDHGPKHAAEQLFKHGCVSGMVSELIYYSDTEKFFARHRREISSLLANLIEDTAQSVNELFGDKWEKSDPLAQETNNRNLLAWFGFEETAWILVERAGWKI